MHQTSPVHPARRRRPADVAFAIAFSAFLVPFAHGQALELPVAQKGTLDTEIRSAGIIAQHDSTAAFDTRVWLAGGRFGRILTTPHGPGWLHGTLEWDFDLGPIIVFSPRQTAYGVEVDPIAGRWNFLRKGRAAPYFEMAGGMVFTNVNVPPGDTASVNIAARAGLGWQIFTRPRRSIDLGLDAWHLSNAWTGRSNPSANGLQLAIGYHWFLQPDTRAAEQVPAGPDTAPTGHDTPQTIQSDKNLIAAAPAITGLPGVFTVETAEVLPKAAIAASAYGNRFSRAPGSVNITSAGLTLSGGLTSKISLVAEFEPYRGLHVDEPSQLSLNFPAGCVHDVYKAPVYCEVPAPPNPNPVHPPPPQSSWKGPAAAYVPGFYFAARNTSDYGPVALGIKANFWSETRGDPLSVSLRADFFIPTESAAAELAKNGAQTGTFDYSFTLGLSKTVGPGIVLANNVTYLVARNPTANGETLLTPGDQIVFGQGFIIPIRRHLQLLTEYTATFFQEGHGFGLIGIDTQNTVRGPAIPVDGVWGVRWNPRSRTALVLGYRYMLNLHQVDNRSGFTIELSNIFG